MNTPVDQFQSLLEKYRMVRPVSPDMQKTILGYRKSDFRKLLKKTGSYSAAFWAAVLVYTGLRRAGIHATLLQSKIIAGLAAAVITTGTVTGVHQGVKYIRKAILVHETTEQRPAEINKENAPDIPGPQSEPIDTHQRRGSVREKDSSGTETINKDNPSPKKSIDKMRREPDSLYDAPTL